MPILIDEQTAALNAVREQCVKAASLYEDAGDHVESADLAAVLKATHGERRQLAHDLATAIANQTDSLPKAADPEQIGLDRLAGHAAAALAEDRDATLVERCLEVDRDILSKLESGELARDDGGVPQELKALLVRLREQCREAIDRLG